MNLQSIDAIAAELTQRFESLETKRDILKAPEIRQLYGEMKRVSAEERPAFGQAINDLRQKLVDMIDEHEAATEAANVEALDITAPFDKNIPFANRPQLLPTELGSVHPLSQELDRVIDIFQRMGFEVIESRQLDDDYNMFEALNFPPEHPARDDYDTFMTEEGLIAPAHTSTMQNRVLKDHQPPIRKVVYGRVFRNEDLDAKHEHTLHQIEGVYVDKKINVGNMLATLKTFLTEYYQQDIEFRTQPSYFPFVEPGLEFALSCPFCQKQGCKTCGYEGWIELIGCGMIHPNVLKAGGIDPNEYTGFAWGFGFDRLVMMKHGIEDIRHFNAGKLSFLRQFTS